MQTELFTRFQLSVDEIAQQKCRPSEGNGYPAMMPINQRSDLCPSRGMWR